MSRSSAQKVTFIKSLRVTRELSGTNSLKIIFFLFRKNLRDKRGFVHITKDLNIKLHFAESIARTFSKFPANILRFLDRHAKRWGGGGVGHPGRVPQDQSQNTVVI